MAELDIAPVIATRRDEATDELLAELVSVRGAGFSHAVRVEHDEVATFDIAHLNVVGRAR